MIFSVITKTHLEDHAVLVQVSALRAISTFKLALALTHFGLSQTQPG